MRSSESGAPWFLPNGLKMPPALVRPCEKSPKMCTCSACGPGVRPEIVPEIVVAASSLGCDNDSTPLTPSPVITYGYFLRGKHSLRSVTTYAGAPSHRAESFALLLFFFAERDGERG